MDGFERLSVEGSRKLEHDAEVEKRRKARELTGEAKQQIEKKDLNSFMTALASNAPAPKRGRPPKNQPTAPADPAVVDANEERARQSAALAKYTRYAQSKNELIREAVGGVAPNPRWSADEAQAQLDRVREHMNSAGASEIVRRGVVSLSQGAEWVTMRAGINPNNMYDLDGFGGFVEGMVASEEGRNELQPELSEAEAELGGFLHVPWQVRALSKFHGLLAAYTAHKRQRVTPPAPVVQPPPPNAQG
jgi:hypothetical protein